VSNSTNTGSSAVLDLTRELIARPSITPIDAGCLELIASRLAPLGFVIERIDSGEGAKRVSNLWARRGNSGRLICFAGHTDVVPTGPRDQWQSDPFVPSEIDGWLYGRGAADMKASLAAAVVAVERLFDEKALANRRLTSTDFVSSMAFLLTSDEEGDATDGTVKVVDTLKARGELIDCCIVGEPTCVSTLGDMIKNGRRGSLSASLQVKGVQGHIAYPHLVKNPIHLAAPAIAELVAIRWDEGNDYFPPTSFQISNAHAGTGAGNVVPGTFDLMFNFRFATASTIEGLQARVHEVLDRHGLEYALSWTLGGRPFLTPRGELCAALGDAIRSVTGLEAELSTTGGTSDGRFIATICEQVAEFGPVNATIHKVNERVELAALEPLARIYEAAFAQLLAQ
jgi:succinyl-diaminopimelate desuccinylase